MQAARLYRPYALRIEEVPDPGRPGPGWVRLRIAAVGICGSDLHYYREGSIGTADVEQPLIMGHEFSAFIDELGPGVEGLEVGQLVAVEPGRACGRCESCHNGHPNLCPRIIFCRMKHTYPQTIALAREGRVDVRSMVTHRFRLGEAVEAFRLADSYADNVLKTVIDVG